MFRFYCDNMHRYWPTYLTSFFPWAVMVENGSPDFILYRNCLSKTNLHWEICTGEKDDKNPSSPQYICVCSHSLYMSLKLFKDKYGLKWFVKRQKEIAGREENQKGRGGRERELSGKDEQCPSAKWELFYDSLDSLTACFIPSDHIPPSLSLYVSPSLTRSLPVHLQSEAFQYCQRSCQVCDRVSQKAQGRRRWWPRPPPSLLLQGQPA